MALSASQLNELPYATAPFSAGLTAADYRLLHDEGGESFRLWRAYSIAGSNRSGKSFVEVELQGIGKARFHTAQRDVQVEGFGKLPVGSVLLSCLPEVAEISPGDRLLRTAPEQVHVGQATITRASGSIDSLPHRFLNEVLAVNVGGQEIDLGHLRVVPATGPGDSERGGLEWLTAPPPTGSKIFVLYKYHPFYLCLGEGMRGQPLGKDGLLLPQRVPLQEEKD